MILRIESIDFVYKLLKEGPPQKDAEEWKQQTYRSANEGRELMGFSYDRAILPHPFRFTNLHLKRFGNNFSGNLVLAGGTTDVFHGISKKFGEDIEKHGMRWCPLSQNGEGYLFEGPADNVDVSIIPGGEDGEARLIGIGTNGARPRHLNSQERFAKELDELETIANVMISAVLSSYPEKEIPKDLTVHLSY